MLPRDKFWYEMDERANYFMLPDGDGNIIDTWYTEKELINEYDFANAKLESDLDLYGEWAEAPGSLHLQKTDGKCKALTGAEFALYYVGETDNLYIGTFTVDESGKLLIENLATGKYQLVETKAPEGYTALEEPICFEINESGILNVEVSEHVRLTSDKTANELTQEWTEELSEEDVAEYLTEQPTFEVTVKLNAGTSAEETVSQEIGSNVTGDLPKYPGDTVYDYTEVTFYAKRTVSVTVSEENTTVQENKSEAVSAPQSALKFDRSSTTDQTAQRKVRDLYTDNGHFTDPDSITVTGAPDGYPWQYVGTGDYSGHYVSHIRVIYDRDDDGNPIVDEDGNYVIKELQHSNGTTLTTDLKPTVSFDGPYDQTTGTRPLQFLMMNEDRDAVYTYCIDLQTPTNEDFGNPWYRMANLEDNDYYASEEAEDHIRNIVMNGYWGTEEGFGSLDSLKEALKEALAAGEITAEHDVHFRNRVKNSGQELAENQYASENYVYTKLNQQVTLTDEIIDGLTEGEALDAMQCAIWAYANGSNAVLDGTDRMIVGDMYYASSAMGDSRNGANDFEGAARTKALYEYLIGLDEELESTVIINDKTFADDISLTIGDEIKDGVYAAELKFTIGAKPTNKDDLKVVLNYTDINGESAVYEMALTGENAAAADEDGYYTIPELQLTAGVPFEFTLEIIGEQYLEYGAYIFTAQLGVNGSQSMVGVAEGYNSVDVSKSMTIEFSVTDGYEAEGDRFWSDSKILVVKNDKEKGGCDNGKPNKPGHDNGKPEDGGHDDKPNKPSRPECGGTDNQPEDDDCGKPDKPNKPENGGCEDETESEIGTKTSELIDEKTNRYEIEIAVPGQGGDTRHDEVILMVDGSYSLDEEWPAMKEAINTIGKTVLNGSGTTQLTLMAFGMGDNEVLVHVTDADELAAALGELPGSLLYGRSSTNCEAGFTGVAEYIENHDESLKDVHVIFISDGNVNTDETPRAFDTNWQTWATKFGPLTVAQAAFEGALTYGENLPEAFTTIFGDRFDGATAEEILTRAFGGEVTNKEFLAFAEQLWTDVYAYSGLTRGEEYPVSDAERAFVKYDKEKGTYIQDLFYYTTYKSAYVTYGDRWTRTPAAADVLAAMDEVKSMYVVDYDGYTAWMDTGITNEKSTFVKSDGVAGLCYALEGALTDLAKTPFNNVVVTDYMSKWVILDESTLKIVDNITGETVWTAADGWLIEENRPTAQEVPVIVELVDASEYEAGGEDVIGNKSGDIYKLTWYVKDGAMLRSDNYSLKYEVTVDTQERGFAYGKDYPANGNTDLTYTDENGDAQTGAIQVPEVEASKPGNGGCDNGKPSKPENNDKPGNGGCDNGKPENNDKPGNGGCDNGKPENNDKPENGGCDNGKPEQDKESKKHKVCFKSGEVSHIDFLLIDKKTCKVEFAGKKEIGKETSCEIPVKEGCISVAFIKQAQSGMIWTSEEVSDEIMDAIVDCVKENDKSYKGHDSMTCGKGEHDLTYRSGKKAKTVTYTFEEVENSTCTSQKAPKAETKFDDKSTGVGKAKRK